MPSIAERLASVRGQIAEATARAGRSKTDVRLLAVSKTKPVRAIEEAYRAGQRDFGENYAQELAKKARALSHLTDLRWHMIGHLQKNKVKLVVPHASVIHTVDSERLAHELGKRASTGMGPGKALGAFVQVNVAREAGKSGCSVSELAGILEAIESEPGLELEGLMTIPPQTDDPDQALEYFHALRRLRDEYGGVSRLPGLSMGMSHDFVQAIQAGATLVRVGTSIFGPREPQGATR